MMKEISNFSVISSNSGMLICATDSYRTNNTLEPLIARQQRYSSAQHEQLPMAAGSLVMRLALVSLLILAGGIIRAI
jgi:hypothetical protein